MAVVEHEGIGEEVSMLKGYSRGSLSTFRLFLKVAEEGYAHPSVRIEKASRFAHTSEHPHQSALVKDFPP